MKNVLVANGCELVTRGKTERLENPRLFRDDRRTRVPIAVGHVLRLARVSEFLELELAQAPRAAGRQARMGS